MEQYQYPPEPEGHTVMDLVQYILDQRAIIDKSNADKRALSGTPQSEP